jgi:hypothetical protein
MGRNIQSRRMALAAIFGLMAGWSGRALSCSESGQTCTSNASCCGGDECQDAGSGLAMKCCSEPQDECNTAHGHGGTDDCCLLTNATCNAQGSLGNVCCVASGTACQLSSDCCRNHAGTAGLPCTSNVCCVDRGGTCSASSDCCSSTGDTCSSTSVCCDALHANCRQGHTDCCTGLTCGAANTCCVGEHTTTCASSTDCCVTEDCVFKGPRSTTTECCFGPGDTDNNCVQIQRASLCTGDSCDMTTHKVCALAHAGWCQQNSDCCSDNQNPQPSTCNTTNNECCVANNSQCNHNHPTNDCCTQFGTGGTADTCSNNEFLNGKDFCCAPTNAKCNSTSDCCWGAGLSCVGGVCTASCKNDQDNTGCALDSQCCSGECDGITGLAGVCCSPLNQVCTNPPAGNDCCNPLAGGTLACQNTNANGEPICCLLLGKGTCTADTDCCGPNLQCKGNGNTTCCMKTGTNGCNAPADCCSGHCNAHVCTAT